MGSERMSDWPFLNQHRIRKGPFASDESCGFNGAFSFALPGEARRIFCIASDSSEQPDGLVLPRWQHVSVSFGQNTKTPCWEIMCKVKDLFFEPEDVVMQLHPAKSRYISLHNGCLHLWRPLEEKIPLPPEIYV